MIALLSLVTIADRIRPFAWLWIFRRRSRSWSCWTACQSWRHWNGVASSSLDDGGIGFFYAQPIKPERAILADPLAWYAGHREQMGPENFQDYEAAVTNPDVVHGMLEDYRAGLSIDHEHDALDRQAQRKIACPLLALWSARDDLPDFYGDVLDVWRPWCGQPPHGHAIASGHHMAEDAPEELAAALKRFLSANTYVVGCS